MKLTMVALTGLELAIVVRVELLVALEVVHVELEVFSWHLTCEPDQPLGISQVEEVAPLISAVKLYHCQVLAETFSVSESRSDHSPGLQVRVLPTCAVPEIVGAVREALWSG